MRRASAALRCAGLRSATAALESNCSNVPGAKVLQESTFFFRSVEPKLYREVQLAIRNGIWWSAAFLWLRETSIATTSTGGASGCG